MNEDLTQTVGRARRGELSDFADLVERFQDLTFGCAYAYLGDFHLAEDASQEAWVRAYLELPRLRDPAAFPSWLRQVTLSCCSRFVRSHRLPAAPLEWMGELASGEPAADAQMIADEAALRVRQAVDELPEHQREAVLLYYMSGFTQRRIAAFLGVPETTVKKRLHDARQRLRERMHDMTPETIGHAAPSRDDRFTRRVLERIEATRAPRAGWSTLLSTMHPTLRAARADGSVARLAGIFGHAFSFFVREDPTQIWQFANIDWGLLWECRDLTGYRFRDFQAILKGDVAAPNSEALQALKEETWVAVTASIGRGIPAIAWAPMTLDQKRDGIGGLEWSLLVGYDEQERTYTVRNHHHPTAYEVPFDGFGYCDPVQWYAVMVAGDPEPVDEATVLRRSLDQAVAYARGTRYSGRQVPHPVEALGLAAYELWRERLRADMTPAHAVAHAGDLIWARGKAAAFLREAAARGARGLDDAAACYEREVELLASLQEVSGRGCDVGMSTAARGEAVRLLDRVVAAEREAVGRIEEVLA